MEKIKEESKRGEFKVEDIRVNIFYSYSHVDEELRERFEVHMAGIKRKGMIEEWHDRKILSGQNFESQIDKHLENADIIIFLVSADFLASDYCYNREVIKAVERHNEGRCIVVPVILRECDWEGSPFESIQGLPFDMKPVKSRHWHDIDEAFTHIVRELKKIIKKSFADKSKIKENHEDKTISFIVRNGISGQETEVSTSSTSTIKELLDELLKNSLLEHGYNYIFMQKQNSAHLSLSDTLFDAQVRDGDTILVSVMSNKETFK